MPSYYPRILDPPFEYAEPVQKAPSPIIIDTFSPRSLSSCGDLSPSSTSSNSSTSPDYEFTQSRAIRVYGNPASVAIGNPVFWQGDNGELWAVFRSPQEPAKESDLEPFAKLKRVDIREMYPHQLSTNPPNPRSSFRLGDWICSNPKCGAHNFGRNIVCIGCSSPRSSSTSPSPPSNQSLYNSVSSLQAAHTNLGTLASMHTFGGMSQPQSPVTVKPSASPRFISAPNLVPSPSPVPQRSNTTSLLPIVGGVNLNNLTTVRGDPTLRTASGHPLLTPSGRAFAIGGRVQNISSDPLSPCIMYWPDNEPFPEQGQIRPGNLVGIAATPTNPKHWQQRPHRTPTRRLDLQKVQLSKLEKTENAEGNGDSISAAVQAERIQLLTNVLLQNSQGLVQQQQQQIQQPIPTQREENRVALLQQLSARVPALSTPSLPTQQATIPPRHQQQQQQHHHHQPMSASLSNMRTMRQIQAQALRSHSVTPPQVHGVRSQNDLLRSTSVEESNPIYQTSSVGRGAGSSLSVEERPEHFELSSLNSKMSSINLWDSGTSPTAPTLLPSFLQEIVSSPTSSEHDLPNDATSSPSNARNDRSRSSTNSSTSSGLESLEVRSIWKLDGKESRLFSSSGSRRGSPTMGK
uniref:RanBP2-type domain-containing protein n=1 Tax=Moniliophthora roreri TaxID=221103 RepID=A0A0W0FYU5_MONRR